MLARAVKRAWPNVAKASELPFPEYWKSAREWLTFHAPRIGDKLTEEFVAVMIVKAQAAESRGLKPGPWIVPEKVKEIWRKAEGNRSKTHREEAEQSSAIRTDEAWEHAAERAAAVNDRFAGRRRVYGR
ncbi:MAG: hypothetical protein IKE55_05635 [Kiritimatiellae bacterium]|nr:hypothetical protein [Kiritimatiellia bacterium]